MIKDPDVPSVADDVNQEGKTVSKEIPRVDFYHWLLVDVPPSVNRIEEGQVSSEVIPGVRNPGVIHWVRTASMITRISSPEARELAGTYAGYDGPCPPWNDEIVHRYIFTVCLPWIRIGWIWVTSSVARTWKRQWTAMCWMTHP